MGTALAASALTTILGLATMFFADFGKFKNSGPSIGLCLVVTLAACLTLAPALLQAFGMAAFWPFGKPRVNPASSPSRGDRGRLDEAGVSRRWRFMASWTVAHPGLILTLSMLILLPPAIHGLRNDGHITYDFLSQLPRQRPSRQGAEFMERHFEVGESGPLTLVVYQPGAGFDTDSGRQQIADLAGELWIPGVSAVRCAADPLGKTKPNKSLGVSGTVEKAVASKRPEARKFYVASEGKFAGNVTRLDVVLQVDPFSAEAEEVLNDVERKLARSKRLPTRRGVRRPLCFPARPPICAT